MSSAQTLADKRMIRGIDKRISSAISTVGDVQLATVQQAFPLMVIVDGAVSPAPASLLDAANSPAVGARVAVYLFRQQLLCMGTYTTTTITAPTAPPPGLAFNEVGGSLVSSFIAQLTTSNVLASVSITQASVDGAAAEMNGGSRNPATWTLHYPSATTTGNGLFCLAFIYGAAAYTSADFTIPSGWTFVDSVNDGSYCSFAIFQKINAASISSGTALTFTWASGFAAFGGAVLVEAPGLGTVSLSVDAIQAFGASGTALTSLTTTTIPGLGAGSDLLFAIGAVSSSGTPNVTAASASSWNPVTIWSGANGASGFVLTKNLISQTSIAPSTFNFTCPTVTTAAVCIVALTFTPSGGAPPPPTGGSTAGLDAIATALGYSTSRAFSDTFSSTTLNPSNWNVGIASGASGGVPWGAPAFESYGLGPQVPSFVTIIPGSGLQLLATSSGCSCIQTYGKFGFTGGLLLASIKMPVGCQLGYWPAFWMLPGVSEPNDNGEIDIFEGGLTQNSPAQNYMCMNYHPTTHTQNGEWFFNAGVDLSADFHTYGVIYTPGVQLQFIFDGSIVNTRPINSATSMAMEIILENIIANDDPGGPITFRSVYQEGVTPTSGTMVVAEIAAYQTHL